jgi:hypothetical protein
MIGHETKPLPAFAARMPLRMSDGGAMIQIGRLRAALDHYPECKMIMSRKVATKIYRCSASVQLLVVAAQSAARNRDGSPLILDG